jgi:uncharacterized damage-inducible protein DinB
VTNPYPVLAAYNQQVNQQFYTACATLNETELKQDRGAFFKSIYGTLNHLLLVDRLWLGGFTDISIAFSSLDEELYADFAEMRTERERTDADIIAWADTLKTAALEAPFNERLTFPTWVAVTHFFNHQTHHRGQLSTLLSQCGLDYGVTDLPWVDGVAALAS